MKNNNIVIQRVGIIMNITLSVYTIIHVCSLFPSIDSLFRKEEVGEFIRTYFIEKYNPTIFVGFYSIYHSLVCISTAALIIIYRKNKKNFLPLLLSLVSNLIAFFTDEVLISDIMWESARFVRYVYLYVIIALLITVTVILIHQLNRKKLI